MKGSPDVRKAQLCLSTVCVRAEDVKSVEEAIRSCDRGRLLSSILWEWSGWHADLDLMPGRARAALRRKLRSMIALMLSAGADRAPHGRIIIPMQAYRLVDARGLLERRIGAAVADLTRMHLADDLALAAGGRACSVEEMRCVEELFGDADPVEVIALTGSLADAGCLAGAPWPTVLGMPIWLPSDLSAAERAMVLAHVVWIMVSEGFAPHMRGEEGAHGSLGALCRPIPDASGCEKVGLLVNLMNYNSCLDSIEAAGSLADALR